MINQSFSTVTPAVNWDPNRNYNCNCDNSHINGVHLIIMCGCGTLLSSLWTPPSDQITVINYFIFHYTTWRCYGDGTIAKVSSCAMLVQVEWPNMNIGY